MRFLACSLALLAVLGAGASARADDVPPPPPLEPRAELALRAGWGTASHSNGAGPFGADFGVRLGLVTRTDFYIGFRVDRFLGENRSVDVYSYDVGLQVGRDFRLAGDHLVLRPLVGFGLTLVSGTSVCVDCTNVPPAWTGRGSSFLAVEAGLSALVFPVPWLFAGADASLFLPAVDDTGAGAGGTFPVGTLFHGELGARFR